MEIELLGQSGCRITHEGTTLYVDPYLSNSVQELDASDLSRLRPTPYRPEELTDASWILITHEHIDHCDPHTIPIAEKASPNSRFMAPPPVLKILKSWGISEKRCHLAQELWATIAPTIQVKAIPAAHPEVSRDEHANLKCVGYLLSIADQKIYIAGDTSVTEEVIEALKAEQPIDVAILPVNERNYFRDRRGIIGNMSIREAFQLGQEIGASTVIPVHWDMFDVNSVDPEEIKAVYRRMQPRFSLDFHLSSTAKQKCAHP